MLSWHHTGFHVHIGARIWPEDETASGNPEKYIVRASFSQERMLYIPAEKSADGSAKVAYQSKDGKTEQTFDALDWLARLVVHIPNKYEQLVRYAGAYSNKSRGIRKKAGTDDTVPSIAPGELTSKQFRRSRARLIQKIYELDPLRCPNCGHQIEDHIDPRCRPDSQEAPGAPRSTGCPQPRPAFPKRFAYPKDSYRTIRTLKSLNTTIGTESPPFEKKIKRNSGSVPNCGRKKTVSHVFKAHSDFPRTIFPHRQYFPISFSPRRSPVRRNMLRRREGAGGRAHSKSPLYFLDKKRVPILNFLLKF